MYNHVLLITRLLVMAAGFSVLTACGGGSSDPAPDPDPPVVVTPLPDPKTEVDPSGAAAFLNRATFGATVDSINALVASNLEDWLDDQYQMEPTLLLPYIQGLEEEEIYPGHRVEGWWKNVVNGEDQLRQRVAFALSEIFVISDRNDFLFGQQEGMAHYYDMLALNAFGNYRDLLEQVTLHPAMGVYLSMLGNEKPDPENNIRPDENYAREVMQLFSIGLVELNLDGTPVLDGQGKPIPTYDQSIIEGFAHVFTGWTFTGARYFRWPEPNMLEPMQAWASFHDTGEKHIISNVVIPAGQTAEEDMAMALDALFNHPNVGPFISYRLIQRLVTSNPSPAYVARVASVFNDNGDGERGDLGAVIKAILLDNEAINGYEISPQTFGKLREPLIRVAHQFRVTNAKTASGDIPFGWPEYVFGQSPQRAPSVFNFFSPDYQQPGEIADADLYAPEFQLSTANNLTGMHNAVIYFTFWSTDAGNNDDPFILDIDQYIAMADTHSHLVDELNLVFMSDQMSDEMRTAIIDYLDLIDSYTTDRNKVLEVIFLILTSSEYAIQK